VVLNLLADAERTRVMMETGIAIEPRAGGDSGRAGDPVLDIMAARVAEAVREGGGDVVPLDQAVGLVWLTSADVAAMERILDVYPAIRWVQFPWAGVEGMVAQGVLNRPITFTCAKGSFAKQVAEHALMLTLVSLRHVVAKARTPRWHSVDPRSLYGQNVTILGGGGIAAELVLLLEPFGCRVRVFRRDADKNVEGADEILPITELTRVLPDTDVLVIALALTPQTRHIVGEAELAALPPHAIVVNVARGAHLDTDALVTALGSGGIAAAGLDVTEPEPLPEGHPLWADPRVLITSHSADSADYVTDMLCARIVRNVSNLREGRPLEGLVDPTLGY
jgi:phosphoglycerate dehydrogenase-like enzyme